LIQFTQTPLLTITHGTSVKTFLVVFGTRPEAIKMAPLVNELKVKHNVVVCVTAQHREMLDQVLDLFKLTPDYDLDIMSPGQDLFDVTNLVMKGVSKVIKLIRPDMLLVHGDTSTTMAASLAAFYEKTIVGHIEAGLRTGNKYSPFPEEINRQITARIASFHFAPTEVAKKNLLKENIPSSNIFVTGNTVIDALIEVSEMSKKTDFPTDLVNLLPFLEKKKDNRIILVTGHRRENFGDGFEGICLALKKIAQNHPEINIVYPVHLNPNVREPVNRILSNIENIYLIEPLDYVFFVKLMNISYLILTDSGGIQEEAPSLGKPVLLMRDTTERQEAVKSGAVKIVGVKQNIIVDSVEELLENSNLYNKMTKSCDLYGRGNASKTICRVLENWV
jgi:UDP-N-acetylglucosamine 2-epimerase (non-hydrolysing)